MRPHNLLVVAVLFLPACSSETAKENETTTAKSTPAPAATPVATEAPAAVAKLTETELKAKAEAERLLAIENEKAAAKAEAARIVKETNDRFASLQKELDESTKAWNKSMRAARTRAEVNKLAAANPAVDIANKLVELAEEFPDSKAANSAWKLAVLKGSGKGKNKACKKLLELAEADPESDSAFDTYAMLMNSGVGEPRTAAMGHLLGKVEKDLESDESFDLLEKMVLIRGKMEPKQKAVDHLLALAETDVDSDKSAKCFALLTRTDNDDAKDTAINKMIEHHINHNEMVNVVGRIVGRMPAAKTETRLKEVCKKSHGKVHGTALVALAEYIGRRDMYREFYGDADEETAKSLGEDLMAYLRADKDPKEMDQLETMLEEFVEGHESIIESAKKQLFNVQHLSIGRVAPDIVGTDFEGVGFKLSDYRGKVVFLDFWGDW